MYKHVVKLMVLVSLAALIGIPAAAQVRLTLGPVHIRIANEAPPRAKYERRSPRPDRTSVWINGNWHRDHDQWAWTSGRWDQRPDRGARWISAKYAREGCSWFSRKNCRWRYVPGHWSNQQVIEGEDYQQWRNQRRSNRGRRGN